MIEAIDLSKRYSNGKLALDALNLRVAAGEIYCLLGAKGAGKTTAVNLFLGFAEPTAGKARIAGADVASEPLKAKAQVAYVADTTTFYRRLTVLQNLDFFARLGGRRRPGRLDCEMALREVGLPESAFAQRVSELDPGGLRKLGIAAALMKGAPALLLDEPLSGLDPKAAAELVELLEELRGQGKALLITMQDLFWARQLADRVGILQEGRQALTRSRDELRYENLEKLYLDYMRGGLRELSAR
ncbi:MAG TPA: ABC transporter ATP-binding protein [Thermoanaerobaculia bacterium]|nr:ABC transporter ATP-binding protein [Thermoanaerobaculia bacterium]